MYNITMSAGLAPVKGSDVAAHELRRVVDDRDAGGIRPHPQREDATVYELSVRLRLASLLSCSRVRCHDSRVARPCAVPLAGLMAVWLRVRPRRPVPSRPHDSRSCP